MKRRDFLGGVTALSLTGCAHKVVTSAAQAPLPPYDALPKLMPIRAHLDRIFRVTV